MLRTFHTNFEILAAPAAGRSAPGSVPPGSLGGGDRAQHVERGDDADEVTALDDEHAVDAAMPTQPRHQRARPLHQQSRQRLPGGHTSPTDEVELGRLDSLVATSLTPGDCRIAGYATGRCRVEPQASVRAGEICRGHRS